ncbi:MAG: hypothetical protein J5379_00575 [Clostridiales bacterium]|nr:hypothetical protein [Clostridiales bacterium]
MDNQYFQNSDELMSDEELKQQIEGMSDDEFVDCYMEGLLIQKGLTGLVGEDRIKAKEELKERLFFLVNCTMVSQLPEAKQEEIATRMQQGEDGGMLMDAALAEAGVDKSKIISEIMETFTNLYLYGHE